LLSKSYAATRRKELSRDRAGTTYAAGQPRLEQGDTVYLTTADAQGNMVLADPKFVFAVWLRPDPA
jgi:gamma-glutamyltranspeptidase/glutathione hydrolase